MSTKKFENSSIEMEEILQEEVLGYLGLSMNGTPYVVPLNYAYIDGKIIFHCALTGKKLDYIRANPQVCFTVGRQSGLIKRHDEGEPCHPDNDSVICYGTARIIEDVDERHEVLNAFNRCFDIGAEEISLDSAVKCGAVEIVIQEMTGRRERDRKCTFWRYSPSAT
jgi:nitroimidazol reductase NimA-like FMN-containing flavoprotein (pyridoxamine 5'-phosphate oxidase superfamily)